MVNIGASVAVFQDDQILLILREDFEVWCLPGGYVDLGESLAGAAVREVYEETGLHVELTRLVGLYSRPDILTDITPTVHHSALFAGRVLGGSLRHQPEEALDVRFFPVDALPENLLSNHQRRIQDAASGAGGSIVASENSPFSTFSAMTRQQLYDLRDQSGLSRSEFYRQHLANPEHGCTVEIAGAKLK